MAYTTINKSTAHFNTKLYTGTGSSQGITGVSFEPSFVWIKDRSSAGEQSLFDQVRGVNKRIRSNTDGAETTAANSLTAFDTDGFTVVSHGDVNTNSTTYASWNWKANGAGSSNTDGATSATVSANATAGFSIVKWTGTGSNTTLGHGLGATPKMIFVKSLSGADVWGVYHKSLGATKYLLLASTAAAGTASTLWNDTEPTSSVFTVGTTSTTNGSGNDYIAYCFAEKVGYSSIGKYTGNGNADGTFVYTGFKPAVVIIKRTDTTKNWYMHDIKRDGYNTDNPYLSPNLNAAETGGTELDLLSNGFKMRSSGTGHNQDAGTYIYAAIAAEPLVGDSPATAR